ncbi:MAG TPA: RNA-binding protein [Alphaproteobacteria bacterium]|nr:RNA-binding protein [Alphaproteobacteria bacterium]
MKQAKQTSRPRREASPENFEAENAREPLRQCIVTRERYPKEVMIRFVAAPDGMLVADLHAKLPGRGAWVIADAPAIEKAVQKHMFGKALDAQVSVPAGLCKTIETLLAKRCLELMGQALGAGQMLLGSGATQAAARAGEVAVAIEAKDGAPDGRRKTIAALRAGGLIGRELSHGKATLIGCFSATELNLALGRENVIHAALPAGGFASRLVAEARRLEGFRPLIPDTWTRTDGPSNPGGISE